MFRIFPGLCLLLTIGSPVYAQEYRATLLGQITDPFGAAVVQFRVAAFNVTNTPLFDVPNTSPTSPLFGVVPITRRNLLGSIETSSTSNWARGERQYRRA